MPAARPSSIQPDTPAKPAPGLSHELRPGLRMHWGCTPLDPAETDASALFIFILPSTPAGGKPHSGKAGRMLLVDAATEPNITGTPADTFQVTLAARRPTLDELLSGHRPPAYIELPLTDSARFCAESIRRCPFAGPCRDLALTARGLDLLAEFIAALNNTTEPPASSHLPLHDTVAQVRAAAERLQSALEHPPSIAELAAAVGLSESTLKRGFRQLYQTTPFGYLRARRMEHARELLTTGKATVLEAAAYVGYSNPSNFAAAFRKQFGVNPKTFQMASRR